MGVSVMTTHTMTGHPETIAVEAEAVEEVIEAVAVDMAVAVAGTGRRSTRMTTARNSRGQKVEANCGMTVR